MCTANLEICRKVKELKELRMLHDELEAEIDALTDEIKAYMGSDESIYLCHVQRRYYGLSSLRDRSV